MMVKSKFRLQGLPQKKEGMFIWRKAQWIGGLSFLHPLEGVPVLYDAFLPSQRRMAGCPTWASWRQHRSVAAYGAGGSAFPAILRRLG